MKVSKRYLTRALKGKRIVTLDFEVEAIEGPSKDGYKTFKPGRQFVHMEIVAK